MDIFGLLTLFGGLALFLFGMNLLGAGLEKVSGGKLERILEKMTNTPIKGVLLGAGVTAIIQSSSATTVMVVGFVNSSIMKLSQAVGIILGANIGTTITAWILSLTGIQGNSLWIQLLKPTSFSPILALVGIAFYMFSKNDRKKDIGGIMLGFAVLMFGMETMSSAVKPLANVPAFTSILTMFSNPVLGVLTGALLTAIIQSSSASVGILQALAITGSIPYASAIPIILGQNIGTCVTALISCIGANKNARRAAFVHLYFNLIGTFVFLVLFYSINAMANLAFVSQPATAAGIALVHTTFNVTTTLLLLPFTKGLEKLACLTIRDQVDTEHANLLDERFLSSPSFALEQCKTLTAQMASLARENLFIAMQLVNQYDAKGEQAVLEMEDRVDRYEDQLGTYLVKLSSKSLSNEDSREVSKLLHSIGDFERISDHAVNLSEVAQEIHTKSIVFSDSARQEMDIMAQAVREVVNLAIDAFISNNLEQAAQVEPLEQVIDQLKIDLKDRHITRLLEGSCTIELGFVFNDLLTNYERVADHCSNIAVYLLELNHDNFDTHEYLSIVKTAQQPAYQQAFAQYQKKYLLP